jgi:glycosyltransferase involved in cell wall biosynthesis
MKLIIQIPCFNEEETLPGVIADLPKKIEGIDQIEYLIINDGSTDRTVAVARELGVHHIVNFKRNKGLAKVFAAGLDACLHLGADIIVNTDGDNQYNGADVEKLIQPILDGKADIVIGERPIDSIEHFSKRKKILHHWGSWMVSHAVSTNLPNITSGFRAFSCYAALRTKTYDFAYIFRNIA